MLDSGSVNAQPYTLLIYDAPYAADVLEAAFPEAQYARVDVATQLDDALAAHHPDAVLAPYAPETMLFFHDLAGTSNGHAAPLRILFPPETPADIVPGDVDVVLISDAAIWGAQLAPLLAMRAENERLRATLVERDQEITLLRERHTDPELEMIKTQIITNVGHELKTPLLQIKAAIKALPKTKTTSKQIHFAEVATARLEDVVHNITQLSQSRNIRLDIALVSDSIELARRWLKNSWKHTDARERVTFDVPRHLPPVMADKRSIGTVLQVLIDNALKFSKGEVIVSATEEDDCVRLSVQDFGIGISSEDQQRIFEAFIQIDAGTTRRFEGVGVGLSLARKILDKHDTHFELVSAPEAGSTFSFTLPIVDLHTV
ncbi:MAG: HAMP domain-containing histidine kinase [Anaerolineae bacterium]|nr:HAMP domain-containing histidine kinase [Anaerolineae bacterium]